MVTSTAVILGGLQTGFEFVEARYQPAAVAHQLAVRQLVRFAPRLDAPRGDTEPVVRGLQGAGRSRYAPRTGHPAAAAARRSRRPRPRPRSWTHRGNGPAPAEL